MYMHTTYFQVALGIHRYCSGLPISMPLIYKTILLIALAIATLCQTTPHTIHVTVASKDRIQIAFAEVILNRSQEFH